MNLKELIDELQKCYNDRGAHPILENQLEIEFDERSLEISEIEWIRNMGCGCTLGANIVLKEKAK